MSQRGPCAAWTRRRWLSSPSPAQGWRTAPSHSVYARAGRCLGLVGVWYPRDVESGAETAHESDEEAHGSDAAETDPEPADESGPRVFGRATGPLILVFALVLPSLVGVAAMLCVGNLIAPESAPGQASVAQGGELVLPWCEVASCGSKAMLAIWAAILTSAALWRALRRSRHGEAAEREQSASSTDE